MRIGRRAVIAAVAAAVALTVAACGGSSDPRSIVLYNGQHPQLTDALVSAFEKQTGIHVSVRTNDGIVLADQLLQEGNASPADVYITENSPELVTLDEHGLLARLDPTTLDQTPARFRTPTGDWIGMALRVSALAYDPARISASAAPGLGARPRPAAVEGQDRDRPDRLGLPAGRRRGDRPVRHQGRGRLARRTEAQRAALPVRRGGGRGRQPRRRRHRRDQPLLLVSPAAGDRGQGDPQRRLLLSRPQRGIDREHLRRRRAQVQQPQGLGAGVRQVPGQPRGPGDPRSWRRLRVPGSPRREPESAASAARPPRPGGRRTDGARQRSDRPRG